MAEKIENILVYSEDFILKLIDWLRDNHNANDLLERRVLNLNGSTPNAKDILSYFMDTTNNDMITTEIEIIE